MSTSTRAGGGFLDLPPDLSDPETALVVVLPVPYEATTSYVTGTSRGPDAILSASAQVEIYDEIAGDEPAGGGIHTLPALDCSGAASEVVDRVRDEVSRHAREGRFVLVLGGEHTLTVGAARGAAEARGELTVVHIDAHADLRDEYDGTPLSHACVARRLIEDYPIVEVGVRSLSDEEAGVIAARRVPVVTAAQVASERSGDSPTRRPWMARAIDAVATDRVYLSIDLDGLDPSIAPAVGTPEPGGLQWYETLTFLECLFAAREVVAADVVELCPIEGLAATDFLAARLAYKIAGHALRAARD
jgi:agmatinase